ncbi:class 1 fructose-bisphosphatase [Sesbania bispinosa]|nr:class 1 fructose-bisphosphatase [Sesbania bispinosa]
MDYPNPKVRGTSHYGISLTSQEILNCKYACLIKKHSESKCIAETPAFPQQYTVEFSPKDSETKVNTNSPSMSNLIQDFHRQVTLKRERENPQLLLTAAKEVDVDVPKRRRVLLTQMAEEATLTMPPNQP